jgi:hypothetical protein
MAIDGKSLGPALSGGGYRAALFGLGSIWRLDDLGLLGRLDRITAIALLSSVQLGQQWSNTHSSLFDRVLMGSH